MLRDILRGKVFGHPIHVMLVHFPAALLPTAAGIDALRLFAGVPIVNATSLLLWPGVIGGWCAVAFGIWDLLRLPPGSQQMATGLIHGGINVTALCGFTWVLFRLAQSSQANVHSENVWIEIACAILILIGNKFGGDLLFRLGVGQIKLTEMEP